MASLSTDKAGNRLIQFTLGKRRTIRLGDVPLSTARKVKGHIEDLVAAKRMGQSVEQRTASWVADLEPEMAAKLASVELVASRQPKESSALGAFLDAYTAERVDVKPATKEVWSQVTRNLKEHFGTGRDLATINEGNADAFKLYLVGQKLAPTTVHKRIQFARMFFRAAMRRKLVASNPFAEVSAKATIRADRQRYVTREETDRLLAAANPTWKVIIALARYGGLRCPSEVLSVRWCDVLWDASRINVTSPKTAHHEGKGSRVIPLYPELRDVLDEAYAIAADGSEYVIDERMRRSAQGKSGWRNCNLRTQFERIIKRAGLTPWPRLFHALRGSRETELAKEFPLHVVTAWLGNTPKIAMKHYLMTTDADFERAAKSAAAGHGKELHQEETPADPTDDSAEFAGACSSVPPSAQTYSGEDRIRISSQFREICADYAVSAAKCAADSDGLAEVVEAWPRLPADLRIDITALVRQCLQKDA